ncbi:hypothetical protein BYT27DRAFT_7059441, partial [Phlegmacium glaucopus]
YIRPCRPHAVVTVQHSVSQGGYLLSWATITDSCISIFHSFSKPSIFQRASSLWDSRELLRRMVAYYHLHFVQNIPQSVTDYPYHIPNILELNDLVKLLSICNIVTLGHIIYHPSY